MNAPWRGVYSAVATPLTDDGAAIDEAALRELVDHTIDAGVAGLVPCGSTGEFASLAAGERMRVVEVVLEQAGGRVPVVPHTGAMSTAEAVALSQHAQAYGAAGVMAVVPYYEPISLDEAADYYADLSASIDIPIMVYNLPPATGLNMTGDWLSALASRARNVRYVKDTSGDLSHVLRLVHQHGGAVSTFVGWDTLTLAALAEGAPGVVIGAANLIPAELVALQRAVVDGRMHDAMDLWARIYPLLDVLITGPYTAAIKGGMEILGLRAGPPRRPVARLAGERAEQLRRALEAFR